MCLRGSPHIFSDAYSIDGILTVFMNINSEPVGIGLSAVNMLVDSVRRFNPDEPDDKRLTVRALLQAARRCEGIEILRVPYARDEAYEIANLIMDELGEPSACSPDSICPVRLPPL